MNDDIGNGFIDRQAQISQCALAHAKAFTHLVDVLPDFQQLVEAGFDREIKNLLRTHFSNPTRNLKGVNGFVPILIDIQVDIKAEGFNDPAYCIRGIEQFQVRGFAQA